MMVIDGSFGSVDLAADVAGFFLAVTVLLGMGMPPLIGLLIKVDVAAMQQA
jgi:hypothetical protein